MCKIDDILRWNPDINPYALTSYLKTATNIKWFRAKDGGIILDDEDAGQLVAEFRRSLGEPALSPNDLQTLRKRAHHDYMIRKMLITSGSRFEGFRISRYGGYVSGDGSADIRENPLFTPEEAYLCETLRFARLSAIRELKSEALAMNCNAVVNLTSNYVVVRRSSKELGLARIVVTVSGVAVWMDHINSKQMTDSDEPQQQKPIEQRPQERKPNARQPQKQKPNARQPQKQKSKEKKPKRRKS